MLMTSLVNRIDVSDHLPFVDHDENSDENAD